MEFFSAQTAKPSRRPILRLWTVAVGIAAAPLAACSGSPSTTRAAPPAPSTAGTERAHGRHGSGGSSPAPRGGRPRGRGGGTVGPSPGAAKDHGDHKERPGNPGPPSAPVETSRRSDLRADGDSYGETPGYSDITAAAVEGSERGLVFTLTVDGTIPRRMPDEDTSMTGTFKVSTDGGEKDLHFTGDANGWAASSGERSIQGFVIRGDSFVVSLPLSFLGGDGRFQWVAQTAWTSSSSGDTYYYFDDAPDDGTAPFPE